MRLFKCICAISIAIVIAILYCNHALAQEKKHQWNGFLNDGTEIDTEDLKKILIEHEAWMSGNVPAKKANLQGASLSGVPLQGDDLSAANLQGTMLERANLQGARLYGANLKGAALYGANLQGTMLERAKLQGASLSGANLKEADLKGANLKGADLSRANLEGVIFEIVLNNLPYIPSIMMARNLSLLTYERSPHALFELREAFKKYGLRRQEREITYAIKHSGYVNAMSKGDLATKFQVMSGRIFFELTCQWGMSPMRPLLILVGFIGLFSPLYMLSLKIKKKKDGIWMVWIAERVRADIGKNSPELLRLRGFKAFKTAFYFSMLSAFQVGWRDLNVGSWIARMQPREYKLQASGWVRLVSGLQSLISVYLLALSVLTYFGRPFESY